MPRYSIYSEEDGNDNHDFCRKCYAAAYEKACETEEGEDEPEDKVDHPAILRRWARENEVTYSQAAAVAVSLADEIERGVYPTVLAPGERPLDEVEAVLQEAGIPVSALFLRQDLGSAPHALELI
jgi:hypothetical protein